MSVDGDEDDVRVGGLRGLLHLEEGRPKGGPAADPLQEGHLGLLHCLVLVLVIGQVRGAKPEGETGRREDKMGRSLQSMGIFFYLNDLVINRDY